MACNCNLCTYDRANPIETREFLGMQSVAGVLPSDSYSQRGILTVLQAIDEVFTNASIPYWICGGTYLGALRHGGFIPHDDDADIECFEADADRIRDAFAASPLLVEFNRHEGAHEGVPVGRVMMERHADTVDVFLREPELLQMREYPSWIEVFPIKRVLFNGLMLNAPGGETDSYLSRCYGQDWASRVKVFFNHMPCRPRLTMDLCMYQDAVVAAGYQHPTVYADTAAESLLHLDRLLLAELGKPHCSDYEEAQKELWSEQGWGSPLPPPQEDIEW